MQVSFYRARSYPRLTCKDGKLAVIVAARMQPHLRVDQWTKSVNHFLTQFEQELPSNIKLNRIFEQQKMHEQTKKMFHQQPNPIQNQDNRANF